MEKVLIIGAVKCGTTSLAKYLSEEYEVVRNVNLFTREDGPQIWNNKYPEHKPIVILRDPAQRAYSDWLHRYRRHFTDDNFDTYVMKRIHPDKLNDMSTYYNMGDLDIIRMSNYEYWLNNWKETPLEVYQLETLLKENTFPHENKGSGLLINDYARKVVDNLLIIEKERVRMNNAT